MVPSRLQQCIIVDHRVAASLQPAQCDLRRNLTKATLFHALQARPSRHDLEERGILESESVSEDNPNLVEKNSKAKMISEVISHIDYLNRGVDIVSDINCVHSRPMM